MTEDRESLDEPADALKLHALAAAGLIGGPALAWGLAQLGGRPTPESWYRFARVQMLLVGASLVAVGTVFFMAANWDTLSAHTQMGLIAGLMAAATLVGWWLGLQSLSGRVAALLGGLGFGPLIALVGQTYQTGADAWGLFAAWTVVLSIYALAIRFAGAWILALILLHVSAWLWADQWLGLSPFEDGGLWVSLGLSVFGWVLGVALRASPRAAEQPTVMAFSLALSQVIGFILGMAAIVPEGWSAGQFAALVWAVAMGWLTLYLFTQVWPDLNLVRGGAVVLAGLLAVAEGKFIFDVMDLKIGGLLVMGVLLIAQGGLFGRWLLGMRASDADEEVEP